MADKLSVAVTLAVVLVVALTGVSLIQNFDQDAVEYTQQADDWCDERNGTLHNAQVLGRHGGLHCELPNGTSVHMNEVITANRTDA